MARILVAGGSGFIGTHMIRHLKLLGHYIISADIEHPRWASQEADVFMHVDLRRQDYAAAVTKNVDWVFNFAADMGGMGFIGDPSLQASILYNNTMINFNLLEGARKNGVKKYFQASSVCIYPMGLLAVEHPIPLCEEDCYPASPQGTYGWEKLQAEHLCQEYSTYGIETRIARFHNVYGPMGTWRGGREKAPAAMSRKIALSKLKGLEVSIWGDGKATRSFMYVEDCVKAVYDLMLSDYGGPITLGPDRSISINELVDIISVIAGVEIKKVYVNEGHQGVRGRSFDHSLCRKIIGWVPNTSVEDGMVETYNWVEKQVEKAIEKGEL